MPKDYYDILGLKRDASGDEIKQAYRRLSKELHPDKHKGDKAAETKFKEVNEAYEVLSNAKKKQMYDQFGSAGPSGSSGAQGFNGFDFSQFSQGAGDFSDLFESFFGGARGAGRTREERGADHEVELTIDLHDVVTGAKRVVSLRKLSACEACSGSGAESDSKLVSCKECGGTGQVTRSTQSFFGVIQQRTVCQVCRGSGRIPEHPCKKCKGEGRIADVTEVMIDIPPGIEDGQTLRLREQGDAGRRGNPAGDLYVAVRVRSDPRFAREGADVRSVRTISALDAMLGIEATIETLHGNVTLKIPDGTQPGQVFRLKGKGLPVLQRSQVGDQYVEVKVEIPRKLSRAEKKLLEEWKKLSS